MAQFGSCARRTVRPPWRSCSPVRPMRPEPGRRPKPLTAPSPGFGRPAAGKDPAMAVGQADATVLEPVVILGLLNSMAVVVAATETLLGSWDTLSNDGDTARLMLERVAAHARVVSDALELAAREVPPTMIEATQKPA